MNIAVDASALQVVRSPQGSPGPIRPREPAHVIRDDAEAIRVAHALAEEFQREASLREIGRASCRERV